jgi:O-methyltransferase
MIRRVMNVKLRTILKQLLPESVRRTLGIMQNSTYAEDGLIAARITEFLFSGKFDVAYRKGKSTGSWGTMDLRWRVFVACWAAQHAKSLTGDFVECGVNRGGMARAVVEYVGFSTLDKEFYPFDYTECFEAVKQTFAQFSNVRVIRGVVPNTLANVESDRVAYLSIDMNCVEPEIAAAEFFWERISPSGVIVLDDYCYSEHYGLQNKAFDEFARSHNVEVLALPTGQGLIFKPQPQQS